jgi:hypothetical protein
MDAYQYDKMLDIQAYNEAADYLKKRLNSHEFMTAVVNGWRKEQLALTADKTALLAELNTLKGEIESTETLLKFAKDFMQKSEPQQSNSANKNKKFNSHSVRKLTTLGGKNGLYRSN